MYNESKIIADTAKTLAAYMADNFEDYEIIFSDDGSTDGSADIVKSLELPCVRVIGYPDKRNAASLYFGNDARSTRIYGILYKLLHDRRGALDHLACGNKVSYFKIENVNFSHLSIPYESNFFNSKSVFIASMGVIVLISIARILSATSLSTEDES